MTILGAAGTILAVACFADILIGPAFLNVSDVIGALLQPDSADQTTAAIVHIIRLPMTCMALLVGAALGIAGTHMQTIL